MKIDRSVEQVTLIRREKGREDDINQKAPADLRLSLAAVVPSFMADDDDDDDDRLRRRIGSNRVQDRHMNGYIHHES